MEFSTGEKELNRVFRNKGIKGLKKRYAFPKLMKYLNSDRNQHVCTLYGLRRTGKTTMMAQAAMELNDADAVCWMHCEQGDSIQDVKTIIKANPQCKYFFLDEVTKLDNFIGASSILADKFAAEEDKKIVMAGTDSLGVAFALSTELFDRAYVIHTTYIPFQEYRYLLGPEKDIDDYIEYGGTLTDGTFSYNQDTLYDYTNDAIAENIQHSLEYFRDGRSFGPLLSLYAADELTTFINKLVEYDNRTFLAKTVNKLFKSHDMGKLRNNIDRDKNLDVDTSVLKSKELNEQIRQALLIKEPILNTATQESIRSIKDYLEKLDAIFIVPGTNRQEVIFTQPGLRYSQVKKQMAILQESPVLSSIPLSIREEFSRRLDETVKGSMMEDILFVQLSKDQKLTDNYEVKKYRDSMGLHEFDLVLTDRSQDQTILFEVKHSKEYVPIHQARHLVNSEACAAVEQDLHAKIDGKAIIYRGKTQPCTQGISYINVNDFLTDPMAFLNVIRSYYQGKSWNASLQQRNISDKFSRQ